MTQSGRYLGTITDALPGWGQGGGMDWARILAYVTGTVDLVAGVERISGCRESNHEGPVEGAAEALGRRARLK